MSVLEDIKYLNKTKEGVGYPEKCHWRQSRKVTQSVFVCLY